MKNCTKAIIFSAALFLSIIGNILFLSQDFFNGTYYGRRASDEGRCAIRVNGLMADCRVYDLEEKLKVEETCYISFTECDGHRDAWFTVAGTNSTVERMHRTSIFAMQGFLEEGWYICPAAIIVQVLWLAADATFIIVFIKIKNKTPCRNQRQGKQTSTEGDSGGDRPGSPIALP